MARTAFTSFVLVVLLSILTSDILAQRSGNRQGRRASRSDANALRVGEMAPGFVLRSLDGKSETDLQSFRGEKPVVLLFGSYT